MQLKSTYELSRSVLRRYMADYTSTNTPPKTTKGGFFAILVKDTGKVWLSESSNFASVIRSFSARNPKGLAACLTEALAQGSELELWLLTQPARFSAQLLEDELFGLDVLLDRKKPVTTGEGDLFVVRHDRTHAYFVVTSRRDVSIEGLLNSYLNRLQVQETGQNKALSDFITNEAQDIINKRGFTITHLTKFACNDDKWLKRQLYIDASRYGVCLNLKGVD